MRFRASSEHPGVDPSDRSFSMCSVKQGKFWAPRRAMSAIRERIGDDERDAAIVRLKEHHLKGRLDSREFEERVATALQAKFDVDLAAVFDDLPASAKTVTPMPVSRRNLWPFSARTTWTAAAVIASLLLVAFGFSSEEYFAFTLVGMGGLLAVMWPSVKRQSDAREKRAHELKMAREEHRVRKRQRR